MRRTVLPGGAARRHRGDARRALGRVRRLGRRRLARRVTSRPPARRTSSSTCCSRAPRAARALDISAAIDAVGGEVNAFTAQGVHLLSTRGCSTTTCRSRSTSSATWSPASLLRGDGRRRRARRHPRRDRDARRRPGDVVHDVFAEALLGDTPLGRPILGTVDSIEAMTRRARCTATTARATARGMVVAAAGSVDHDAVVRPGRAGVRPGRRGSTGDAAAADAARRPAPHDRRRPASRRRRRRHRAGQRRARRCPALTATRRAAVRARRAVNAALGGGMSSRLFQEIREKRGLAYSVYSFASQYADTGLFGVYAGCQPGKVDEVLAHLPRAARAVAAGGITRRGARRAARARCAAAWCSAWRTPARG